MQKNRLVLFIFSLAATGLNFILLFVITYLLDKESYGNFVYFHSIGAIIASISSLRLELTITDAHSPNKAISWLIYPLICSPLIGSLGVLLTSYFLNLEKVELIYIAIISPLICYYAVIQQFYIVRDKHLINSVLLVIIPFINILVIYFFRNLQDILFISNLLAYSTSILIGFGLLIITHKKFFSRFKFIPLTFNDYKRYLFFSFPIGVITSWNSNFINVIVGNVFGQGVLGVFSIANKIVSVPFTSIGGIWASLARADFSREYSIEGKIKYEYRCNFTTKTIAISILSNLLILLPSLAVIDSISYFEKYPDLNKLIIHLIPFGIINFVLQVWNSLLVTVRILRFYLIINLLILSFTVTLVMTHFVSIYQMILLYNCLYAALFIYSLTKFYGKSKLK